MQSILQSYILTALLSAGAALVSIVALIQFLQTGNVSQSIVVLWGTLLSLLNSQAHLTTTAKVTSLEQKISSNGN